MPKKTESTKTPSTESGIKKTKNESLPRLGPTELSVTPPTGLPISQTQLKEAMLDSVSLLDESAMHLFGLMKSYGKHPESQEEEGRMHHRQIQQVCNLGKNINEMIKTKLGIAKEFRK